MRALGGVLVRITKTYEVVNHRVASHYGSAESLQVFHRACTGSLENVNDRHIEMRTHADLVQRTFIAARQVRPHVDIQGSDVSGHVRKSARPVLRRDALRKAPCSSFCFKRVLETRAARVRSMMNDARKQPRDQLPLILITRH